MTTVLHIDAGSVNSSRSFQHHLGNLGVKHETHVGNQALSKGAVEQANILGEKQLHSIDPSICQLYYPPKMGASA